MNRIFFFKRKKKKKKGKKKKKKKRKKKKKKNTLTSAIWTVSAQAISKQISVFQHKQQWYISGLGLDFEPLSINVILWLVVQS